MEAQLQALQDDFAQQQAQSQALLQQLQQQQALIQQLLQAQQQQALIVPPQPPAVPFALMPAQAIKDVVDLTETAGIKLHKAVTTPLATLYDSSPQKLASFLENVKQHATDCGWMAPNGLLIINNQDPVNPHDYNLITYHCMLSLENVYAKALTYVGQQTRAAQNAYWMYKSLCDSLPDGAHIRITVKSAQFKVKNREDGPC